MLILDLKLFRSYAERKQSIGRKYLGLAVRGKTAVDINNLVISKNGDRKRKCYKQGFLEWLVTFFPKFSKNHQDQGG